MIQLPQKLFGMGRVNSNDNGIDTQAAAQFLRTDDGFGRLSTGKTTANEEKPYITSIGWKWPSPISLSLFHCPASHGAQVVKESRTNSIT